MFLAGGPGTGKSYKAKALLLIGCQKKFRCRYTTATNMLQELLSGLANQSLETKLKRYLSPEVLPIDELGFDRMEQHEARNVNLFHKVIDGRYCEGSTILTLHGARRGMGQLLKEGNILWRPIAHKLSCRNRKVDIAFGTCNKCKVKKAAKLRVVSWINR